MRLPKVIVEKRNAFVLEKLKANPKLSNAQIQEMLKAEFNGKTMASAQIAKIRTKLFWPASVAPPAPVPFKLINDDEDNKVLPEDFVGVRASIWSDSVNGKTVITDEDGDVIGKFEAL